MRKEKSGNLILIIGIPICIILYFVLVMLFGEQSYDNNEVRDYVPVAIMVSFSLVSVLLVILAHLVKITRVIKGDYVRDPDKIIKPIFAQSIIEGKLDSKNLIITVICDLVRRGNLENIDNDSIRLIYAEDLTEIEKRVIVFLFSAEYTEIKDINALVGKTIKISNLPQVFKDTSRKAKEIFLRFIKIRDLVNEELVEQGIISRFWRFVLKQIKIISTMLILNSLVFMILSSQLDIFDFSQLIFYVILLNFAFFYCANIADNRTYVNDDYTKKERYPYMFLILSFLEFGINMYYGLIPINIAIIYTGIVLLNIAIIGFSKIYVFRKKGKDEFRKIYSFRKYMIDFELMKNRDIEGTFIYDKYLVYAAAFGIPCSMTDKINQVLINTRINFQMITKFLTL